MPLIHEHMSRKRIAVIGAGPGGLAAAKYLKAETCFDTIDVFDQRDEVGGVWNATLQVDTPDKDFKVPRTNPNSSPTQPYCFSPHQDPDSTNSPVFLSPIYDSLNTNIPYTLMEFSDLAFPEGCPIFPPHQVVLNYLREYAADLRPYLRLGTQVVRVKPEDSRGKWRVLTKKVATGKVEAAVYDAVVVASGHYDDPYIPNVPGLAQWSATYPGAVTHSKYYRRPGKYKNKKVIVVGNSASGIDISREIATVSQRPLLVSEKEASADTLNNPAIMKISTISSFDIANRKVNFSCGRTESEVDHVVFCTGYMYSFPFLDDLNPLPNVITTGIRVENLYHQMIYHPCPSLFFIGLPQRVVPFPISEAQSAVIARVLSGRLQLPESVVMRKAEEEQLLKAGMTKAFHTLGYPQDADYINYLHQWVMTSTKSQSLENGGVGKLPPFWDEEKRWLRRILPQVKEASKLLGQKRLKVCTVKELGFSYPS